MKYILAMSLLLMEIALGGNKIVYLISPPRCLSTAVMRSCEARKDFAVINEPAWNAYNLLLYGYDQTYLALLQETNYSIRIVP